ncbi:unnamed protein product, partial [Prorocentrum cordatum]
CPRPGPRAAARTRSRRSRRPRPAQPRGAAMSPHVPKPAAPRGDDPALIAVAKLLADCGLQRAADALREDLARPEDEREGAAEEALRGEAIASRLQELAAALAPRGAAECRPEPSECGGSSCHVGGPVPSSTCGSSADLRVEDPLTGAGSGLQSEDLFFSLTQVEDFHSGDEDAAVTRFVQFVFAAVAVMMMVTCCGRCSDEGAGASELRRMERLESRGRQVMFGLHGRGQGARPQAGEIEACGQVADLPARRPPPGTYAPLAKKMGSNNGQLD